MDNRAAHAVLAMLIAAALICLFVLASMVLAQAQSSWWGLPEVRRCCSAADAVYADDWEQHGDGTVTATVTGGGPQGHAWAPIGRKYNVPVERVLQIDGNPTGRALLFLSPHNQELYCFARGPLG